MQEGVEDHVRFDQESFHVLGYLTAGTPHRSSRRLAPPRVLVPLWTPNNCETEPSSTPPWFPEPEVAEKDYTMAERGLEFMVDGFGPSDEATRDTET